LPKRLNPDDPLQAFAIELRLLRERAGSAGAEKATCAVAGINRTTYFAWLAGKQLPGRDALERAVKAWGGVSEYWVERRRQTEAALVDLSVERQTRTAASASRAVGQAYSPPLRVPRQIAELKVSPQFDAERRKRVDEGRTLLRAVGFDEERSNERSSYILLSLLALGPETPWTQAQMPVLRIRDIMDWLFENYRKAYAPNSRESIRRLTLHQFCAAGIIVANPDRPDRPINSPSYCYQIAQSYYPLLCAYGTDRFEELIERLRSKDKAIN